MTLREWMQRENLTQVETGKRIGLAQAAVSALLSGSTPTLRTANKVRLATAGAVNFLDWLPIEERHGEKPSKAGRRG